MLEVGENPTLCRNGEDKTVSSHYNIMSSYLSSQSPIQQVSNPGLYPGLPSRSAQAVLASTFTPARKSEGFLFSEKEKQPVVPPLYESSVTLPFDERVLTEVDHLLETRIAAGVFDESALRDVELNMVTAVQEAAMPYAVTETDHEVVYDQDRERRTFMWLGKTAVQTAMSGYRFHQHENALKRVDVEVAEARHATETLAIGKAQVFISPRMTRADASLEEAQKEHLGDDDAVRVSWLEEIHDGSQRRKLQSLLVRDIPFDAWVHMLKDPANIFGKSIELKDEVSALSVMRAFPELEVERERLPNGPVTILEEVTRYITDEDTRQKVEVQIGKYYGDQELMKQQAEFKAAQWLEFECELAESLATGTPTSTIKGFIASMQNVWNEAEREIINKHALGHDLEYMMTRDLAVVLEKMKQNTLWGGAAVLSGNTTVAKQIRHEALVQIRSNEEAMFAAYSQGQDVSALLAQNSRLIGGANIKVGGGCAGSNDRSNEFDPTKPFDPMKQEQESPGSTSGDWESNPNSRKWKKGVCQVQSCSTRPGTTEVGPCSVCKSCQAKFDQGKDPTKEPPSRAAATNEAISTLDKLFESRDRENEARDMIEAVFAETDVRKVETEVEKDQTHMLAAV